MSITDSLPADMKHSFFPLLCSQLQLFPICSFIIFSSSTPIFPTRFLDFTSICIFLSSCVSIVHGVSIISITATTASVSVLCELLSSSSGLSALLLTISSPDTVSPPCCLLSFLATQLFKFELFFFMALHSQAFCACKHGVAAVSMLTFKTYTEGFRPVYEKTGDVQC